MGRKVYYRWLAHCVSVHPVPEGRLAPPAKTTIGNELTWHHQRPPVPCQTFPRSGKPPMYRHLVMFVNQAGRNCEVSISSTTEGSTNADWSDCYNASMSLSNPTQAPRILMIFVTVSLDQCMQAGRT